MSHLSCTIAAKAAFSSAVSGRVLVSRYRLLGSSLVTLSSPTDVQMLVALVEKAVEKLVRGPTSTTAWLGSLLSKMLLGVSCWGSKVSRSNLQV